MIIEAFLVLSIFTDGLGIMYMRNINKAVQDTNDKTNKLICFVVEKELLDRARRAKSAKVNKLKRRILSELYKNKKREQVDG